MSSMSIQFLVVSEGSVRNVLVVYLPFCISAAGLHTQVEVCLYIAYIHVYTHISMYMYMYVLHDIIGYLWAQVLYSDQP